MKMPKVCPWWLTYTFDNPLRKFIQDPDEILSGHIREGMRVADIGCGMGYFSIPLARLVGDSGHVQAIDLQQQQLKRVEKRARKSGMSSRITTTLAGEDSLLLNPDTDFILAFAVIHEVPSKEELFRQMYENLKPGGRILIAEPTHHVKQKAFDEEIESARKCGFIPVPNFQKIRTSRVALLEKPVKNAEVR
ncbi:MAG: class I SAM-dependent methyltransferase [Acidobacteriota bacterium]|jgi:2-polyprenyl-3-methyl-5-hydroxy-6-metoxy-1,4-benzoquinol methylase